VGVREDHGGGLDEKKMCDKCVGDGANVNNRARFQAVGFCGSEMSYGFVFLRTPGLGMNVSKRGEAPLWL